MALNPPDMESCNEKARCLGGTNDGVAYDKDSPCPQGWTFDKESCDCISPCYGGVPGTVRITRNLTTWSWESCLANVCYVDCPNDYWRPCVTNTTVTNHHLNSANCIVLTAQEPNDHCDDAPPCDYGRFIFLYNCSCPDPACCGVQPFTFIDAGSQCGACMSGTVEYEFIPD